MQIMELAYFMRESDVSSPWAHLLGVTVQLSQPYVTPGKTIALNICTLCLLSLFMRNVSRLLFLFFSSNLLLIITLALLILSFLQELHFQTPSPYIGPRPGLLGELLAFLELFCRKVVDFSFIF